MAPSTIIVSKVLKSAPDSVIRFIKNTALNAQQGDIMRDPRTKSYYQNHSKSFEFLQPLIYQSTIKKHHIIRKEGTLQFVAPLIASVLGSFGSLVIFRIFLSNRNIL